MKKQYCYVLAVVVVFLLLGCGKELGQERIGGGNGNGNSESIDSEAEIDLKNKTDTENEDESDNASSVVDVVEQSIIIKIDYKDIYINDTSINYEGTDTLNDVLDKELEGVESVKLLDKDNGDRAVTQCVESYLEEHNIDVLEVK